MCYVYGIIDAPVLGCPAPTGHDGAGVTPCPAGDIAAVVSDAIRSEIETSVESVWRHEQVLSALMDRHAVLPMRFGTICDPRQLVTALKHRRGKLAGDLQRVRGRLEIAVRLSARTPATIAEPPEVPAAGGDEAAGTAYLMARVRQQRRAAMSADARAVAETIKARLERLSADALWNTEPTPERTLKGALLVAKDRVTDFLSTAEALSSQQQEIAVTCTGPWAPYSFVGASAEEDPL